jgi:hypothetical protein
MTGTGASTSSQGFKSNPLTFLASAFSSSLNQPVSQVFQWLAEPVGNNTPNPSATLNLRFGSESLPPPPTGYVLPETGFSISGRGAVTIGGGTPIVEDLSRAFTISVPSIGPNNCATLPLVTFSGASDGDTIALGVKNALTSGGNLTYFAWVSATDNVTIKVCNPHGTTNSVLSDTIRADIWKH